MAQIKESRRLFSRLLSRNPLKLSAVFFAFFISGCAITTVTVPDRILKNEGYEGSVPVKVLYSDKYSPRVERFLIEFEKELSRELKQDIKIAFHEIDLSIMKEEKWSEHIVERQNGELTIVIYRKRNPGLCGTPYMVSLFTLGLIPVHQQSLDHWGIDIYNTAGIAATNFDFDITWDTYAWLPFLPVMPLNLAWRTIRGDEYEYFRREVPGLLREQLANL